MRAGEAEELPQHGQSPLAGLGQHAEEGLDVMQVDQRPIEPVAVRIQEQGQVSDGGQGLVDGVLGAGSGPGPTGTFLVLQQGGREGLDRGLQRAGNCVDPTLPAAGRQLLGLVGGQREMMLGEEVLQAAGQRPDGPAGAAGTVQHGPVLPNVAQAARYGAAALKCRRVGELG